MDKFWENYIKTRPTNSKGAFDAFKQMHQDPRPMAQGSRNMYAGGQLVTPSADGSRPGYGGYDNVYKNKQGNWVFRQGKGDDVIYRSGFKSAKAASAWGEKEFVKKYALPKDWVTTMDLNELIDVGTAEGSGSRSPFYQRPDRPNYLRGEAEKLLKPTKVGTQTFWKKPNKKQVEYLKKYSKAPLITEGLAKNVQIILDSKAIMNDLSGKNKGGAKLPEFNKVVKVFKNAGVNASDAQITNALQKAAYLLRGDTFQSNVDFKIDKNTGKFVLKELENLPFDNQYARGIYKHALNEIRAELGDTAGNLESFKRNLRKRLPDGFLQKHGLEINEIFSVRASFKNKSFPYAYFIDATDAELNKKALRSFHGALSNAQFNLNNKIKDIRAGKAKYDDAVEIVEKFQKTRSKFKNTIETNYPGKKFNLADIVLGKESEILKENMKIPEDVYSKKLLNKWADQGLDITGHAKKTGYVMTGAANEGVFTAQDLSRDKLTREKLIKTLNKNPALRKEVQMKLTSGVDIDEILKSPAVKKAMPWIKGEGYFAVVEALNNWTKGQSFKKGAQKAIETGTFGLVDLAADEKALVDYAERQGLSKKEIDAMRNYLYYMKELQNNKILNHKLKFREDNQGDSTQIVDYGEQIFSAKDVEKAKDKVAQSDEKLQQLTDKYFETSFVGDEGARVLQNMMEGLTAEEWNKPAGTMFDRGNRLDQGSGTFWDLFNMPFSSFKENYEYLNPAIKKPQQELMIKHPVYGYKEQIRDMEEKGIYPMEDINYSMGYALPKAEGGRAGYMGGGITGIRKPHAIPPERQGLRSIMINGKKS